MGHRWNAPLDGGLRLPDQRPVLGPSKTIRGVLTSGNGNCVARALVRIIDSYWRRIRLLGDVGRYRFQFFKAAASNRLKPLRATDRSITGILAATLVHATASGWNYSRNTGRGCNLYPCRPGLDRVVQTRSSTLKMMQGYLRWTVDSDIDYGSTRSGRGISHHPPIVPRASTKCPRTVRIAHQRNTTGQTNLTRMRMATE